jgi:thiamine biosynthesis lipoprotein
VRYATGCSILLLLPLLAGTQLVYFESAFASDSASSPRFAINDSGWCEDRRWVMGTQLRIVIMSDCEEIRDVMNSAFEEAKRWDTLLSNYDPASPLSEINTNAGEIVDIPEDLFRYLDRAKMDAGRTDGVFDITVGALVRAYQAGQVGTHTLAEILRNVGIAKLEVHANDDGYHARLAQYGMALDPGGDGKGVAVDAMVGILREAGVKRAFLDFGGSTFYGLGAPPMTDGWTVAISGEDGRMLGTVLLKDQALSVSATARRDLSTAGDYNDGLSMAHIVDPRSGSLIVDPRTTVVVSALSVDTEVLSTVLVVTGERGLRFCDGFRPAVAAVFEPYGRRVTWGEFDRYFEPVEKPHP